MKKELKNKVEVLEKVFEWKEDKERQKEKDGFYIISLETPQEIKDILFKNEFEVDDYNYQWYAEAFGLFIEAIEEAKTIEEAIQLVEDYELQVEADIYTSDLTEWLNSSNYRVEYLETAVKEYGATTGFDILIYAQYAEKSEIMEHARVSFIDYLKLNE